AGFAPEPEEPRGRAAPRRAFLAAVDRTEEMMRRDPLANPEELIRRLYSYVAYAIGDGPDAEDVTSEAFERAIRYRKTYDPAKGSPAGALPIAPAGRRAQTRWSTTGARTSTRGGSRPAPSGPLWRACPSGIVSWWRSATAPT